MKQQPQRQTQLVLAISEKLIAQNIKSEDIPSFDNDVVVAFFESIYATYPEAYEEVVWMAVGDSTRVAYSKRKPDGSYSRVVTTIGKWLKRIDPKLDDNAIKTMAERYKTLSDDSSSLILQVCQNSREVIDLYADDTVCTSCMTSAEEVEVYDSPDVCVVYARHNGAVVGRAVCNRQTKEFVRAYPTGDEGRTWADKTDTEWRRHFLALLEREGYTNNTKCLL